MKKEERNYKKKIINEERKNERITITRRTKRRRRRKKKKRRRMRRKEIKVPCSLSFTPSLPITTTCLTVYSTSHYPNMSDRQKGYTPYF